MNREVAERLLAVLAHLDTPLSRFHEPFQLLEDESEKAHFKSRLVALMTAYMDLLDDVVSEYPEFDVVGSGEEYWYQLRKRYELPDFPVSRPTEEQKIHAERAGDEVAAQIKAEMDGQAPPNE